MPDRQPANSAGQSARYQAAIAVSYVDGPSWPLPNLCAHHRPGPASPVARRRGDSWSGRTARLLRASTPLGAGRDAAPGQMVEPCVRMGPRVRCIPTDLARRVGDDVTATRGDAGLQVARRTCWPRRERRHKRVLARAQPAMQRETSSECRTCCGHRRQRPGTCGPAWPGVARRGPCRPAKAPPAMATGMSTGRGARPVRVHSRAGTVY